MPPRPKNAGQLEAEGATHTELNWRDFTFTIAASADDWPVHATLAFEQGKAATGVQAILGDEQWAALMDTKPTNRDLTDLFDAIAQRLGLQSAGN